MVKWKKRRVLRIGESSSGSLKDVDADSSSSSSSSSSSRNASTHTKGLWQQQLQSQL